jgi:paraquat-inducible protein A
MNQLIDHSQLISCTHCHLIQKIPGSMNGNTQQHLYCSRCDSSLNQVMKGLQTPLVLALCALMIYPFGIFLPLMQIERFGHVHKASIWDGTISLISHGQWFIGVIVFSCSVIFPLLKLAGIFFLCLDMKKLSDRNKIKIFKFVENVGRWGMIDVLLVAILVAVVKIGEMVEINPGVGSTAFGLCVVMSICASLTFDPSNIWSEKKTYGR